MTVSDLDRLFRAGVEAAGSALAAGRPLYPFGLGLTVDGAVVAPQVDPGQARPPVEEVLALVRAALLAARDDLRAAAVVADVRVDGEPALLLELEEQGGEAVVVTVRYLPGPVMQEPVRGPGTRRTFV